MTTHDCFKSRFSPSPTGLMHLGNLRTALFNVLLAKSHQGDSGESIFLLRIEDTDLARSEEEFVTKLMHDLLWMGLAWQEGPSELRGNEPYYQSARVDIYQKYYQQLLKNHQAYWCFCTEAELSIARKNQLNAGLPPRYPGTCRFLTDAQREAKTAKGLKPALRFQIPDNDSVQFQDFIQGSKVFATDDIGDFIIQKADGSASFMFCNAVDDALMQVTHVMRGEDHLTNTPRQLLILKALGLRTPLYGHMPLILGSDGKPLSKRNGSQSVEELRNKGYFPIAINNYLSRLGHHFDNDKLLSLEELGAHFSVENIGRSPARFDMAQLDHWQKETVLSQSPEDLWQWMKTRVDSWVEPEKEQHFIQTIKQNVLLPSDAEEWAERLLANEIPMDDEAIAHIQTAGEENVKAIESAIHQEGDNYSKVHAMLISGTSMKGKSLFMPLRAIFTGRCYGPELAKIFPLMGKALLLNRVHHATQFLHKTIKS